MKTETIKTTARLIFTHANSIILWTFEQDPNLPFQPKCVRTVAVSAGRVYVSLKLMGPYTAIRMWAGLESEPTIDNRGETLMSAELIRRVCPYERGFLIALEQRALDATAKMPESVSGFMQPANTRIRRPKWKIAGPEIWGKEWDRMSDDREDQP